VIDLAAHRVVGWAVAYHLRTDVDRHAAWWATPTAAAVHLV